MPIAGIVILVIAAVIVIWLIAGYNGFVRARNRVEEAFSTMDVYLKKRFDLIPNLVETVKGYADYERETLQKVVDARTKVGQSGSVEERAQSENELSGTLRTLFAVAEGYPDLKANQNFLDLQAQLRQVEEDIANARKYYNAVVRRYNNRCEVFPNSLLAKMFHFERKTMFEVDDAAERENVKVDMKI